MSKNIHALTLLSFMALACGGSPVSADDALDYLKQTCHDCSLGNDDKGYHISCESCQKIDQSWGEKTSISLAGGGFIQNCNGILTQTSGKDAPCPPQ